MQLIRVTHRDGSDRLFAGAAGAHDGDVRTHALEGAHEADTGGIEADVLDLDIATGNQQGAANGECRRRGVSGHGEHVIGCLQGAGTVHGCGAEARSGIGTVFGQHELGMVAGGRGLAQGGSSLGAQARQDDRGLQLRRCHRRIVVDGLERPGSDFGDGQMLFTRRLEANAHLHERCGNTTHGTGAQGIVAGERDLDIPRGEHAHEQARGGSGVPAIDIALGLLGTLRSPTGNGTRKASIGLDFQIHLGTQLGYRPDG